MEYVCDAPNDRTWFRLVTEGEAVAEVARRCATRWRSTTGANGRRPPKASIR